MENRVTEYFCHVCKNNIFAAESSELFCPLCQNDLIEIIDVADDPNIFYGLPSIEEFRRLPLGNSDIQSMLNNQNALTEFFRENVRNAMIEEDEFFADNRLDNLINILMQNDPNRHGTPPASVKEIESLPRKKATTGNCSICLELYKKSDTLRELPCKHDFHEECLLDWLSMHNSCPVCRHELKTDDPSYEQYKKDKISNLINRNN